MMADILSYLQMNSPQILAYANNYIKTGVFKTAASLVASQVATLLVAW
jgi:hypothetical protein